METIYYSGAGSSAHIYGNVASLVKEFVLSKFEEDFFNHVFISTEHISREVKKNTLNNDEEMFKFIPPELSINPRFDELSTKDIFLKNTILTTNFGTVEQGISRMQLFPVLKDRDKNLSLCYKMDRDRLVFDITIYLPSAHMQLDRFKSLQHQLNTTSHFVINTSLESMLPRSMVAYLGKLYGWDINNMNHTSLILNYLNTNSHLWPFSYKMKTSTANDEFFMYYNAELLCECSDLQAGDGSKVGEVDEAYPITFTMMVDFNNPVTYFLVGESNNPTMLELNVGIDDRSSNEFVPLYTLHHSFNLPDVNGLQHYRDIAFVADTSAQEEYLDLSPLIIPQWAEVINEQIAIGIDPKKFIRIEVVKQRQLLTEDKDWKVNWQNVSLTIFNTKEGDTYRLIIYADKRFINEKITDKMNGGISINDFAEFEPIID